MACTIEGGTSPVPTNEIGITIAMFLGQLKYYRQSYCDRIDSGGFAPESAALCRLFLERCFDRMKIGFCTEWLHQSSENRAGELQAANRLMTNEKKLISHDLQKPLRTVSSFVDILTHDLGTELDGHAKDAMRFIVEGTRRMQAMIKDLRGYNRLILCATSCAKISMADVLEDVIQNLSLSIRESGAEITADALPDVYADRSQLLQLLQNLIANAIKYKRDEAPRIHVGYLAVGKAALKGPPAHADAAQPATCVAAQASDCEPVFYVRDNGLGIDQNAGRFVGGRGFSAKIYWDRVKTRTGALDPDNVLMFMTGPLAGTPAMACSRVVVSGKSPLSYPEQYGLGSIGGSLAIRTKAAGYDGLIISGRSPKPVYLHIENGSITIRDAAGLWGADTHATLAKLGERYGSGAESVCIGPAGERLVRFALAMSNNGSCGGHGFGAVMGSKRLKAIVLQGDAKPAVAHPSELQEVNRRIRSLIRGHVQLDPFIEGIELVKRAPCKGCPAGCSRGVYKHSSGRQEHRKNCASAYFYSDWDKVFHKGAASGQSFLATSLCDRMGLDTQEFNKLLLLIDNCGKAGIISAERLGLPLEGIGSLNFFERLVEMIIQRDGFGDVLAEGTLRTAQVFGSDAPGMLAGELDRRGFSANLYNPRYFLPNAVFHATDPTAPMSQLHEVCYPLFKWVLWYASEGGMSPVSTEVFRNVARRFWGSAEAADFSRYEGKGAMAALIQNRAYARETLVACDFFYPIMTAAGAADHCGDPGIESRLLAAVTGLPVDEAAYLTIGERVFNMKRAIQCREGHAGRAADTLPEFNFTEPPEEDRIYFGMFNPDFMLPGPGGDLISRKGAVLDRAKFNEMMDKYYRARGWDVASGLQTMPTLLRLGLAEQLPQLERDGHLGTAQDLRQTA